MTRIAHQTGRRAGMLGFVAAASVLLQADPAQAQFGRDYVRYSMYGSGPYGYGSRGYYMAATPEPSTYHTAHVRETDYGYDPRPVREYYPTGRGVYGPYGVSLYEFGVRHNVYGSEF